MKPKILLSLSLVLSVELVGCSTATNHGNSTVGDNPTGFPLRYCNSEYGLTFFLPESWRGYSIVTGQWEAEAYSPVADKLVAADHGPMIVFRNPKCKTSDPHQDIPVLMFTRSQWDAFHDGKLGSLYAGGVIYEMWHNDKYVFGIYSRYNANDSVKGWDEAAAILTRNCAANEAGHLYAQ